MKDKKPRTDKRKNVGKVAEKLIENPNKTEREIAKETWLWKSTVNRAKQELGQTGLLQKILDAHEEKQIIFANDIKDSIDGKLLTDFVVVCWSKVLAVKRLEEYMSICVWKTNPKRNINDNTRYALLHKSWFKCMACWESPQPENDIVLHIDHIVPVSLWWHNKESNYQVLCNKCNASKWNYFTTNHRKDER